MEFSVASGMLVVSQDVTSGIEWVNASERLGSRVEFKGARMAGIREVVDGASEAARSAAAVVVGVGDGLVGGVVGSVSGAVNGLTGGGGAVRGVSPGVAVAVAGVAAGALGLVDWPLLALAGGAALVFRRLRVAPAPPSRTAAVSARATGERTTNATAPARKRSTAPRKTASQVKGTARKRASASTSRASQGSGE